MIRRDTAGPVHSQADDTGAFEQEQRNSAWLSFRIRALALAIIGVALAFRLDGTALTFYLSVLVVLLANGALIQFLLHPDYVSLIRAAQDAVLLVIAGAVVAVAVWRGRRHMRRQISEARDRARLARYFSPDVAAELTARRAGFLESRTPEAAVIFADIVGFTTLAEQESPEGVLAFLREFHRHATGAVFAHDGTLNKFIGDEVMASFGAIHDVETPAASALECALEMAGSMRDWSRARVSTGQAEVRVGIGVHVGPVVVGNIGNDSILELAVLGDTVNVASRLQKKTRAVDAEVVASRQVIEAALLEKPGLSSRLTEFEAIDEEDGTLKGRSGAMPALKLSLR